MSVRDDAPYKDEISEDGKRIVYEGHNLNKRYHKGKSSNTFDQLLFLSSGKLTENGKFAKQLIILKMVYKNQRKLEFIKK